MFFKNKIVIRVSDEQRKDIEKILFFNQDKYDNISHFCRCGIIREIRSLRDDYMKSIKSINIKKKAIE